MHYTTLNIYTHSSSSPTEADETHIYPEVVPLECYTHIYTRYTSISYGKQNTKTSWFGW